MKRKEPASGRGKGIPGFLKDGKTEKDQMRVIQRLDAEL